MMFVDTTRCAGCGACVHACQENAITLRNGSAAVDETKCIGCGECAAICPVGVIHPVELIDHSSIISAEPDGWATVPHTRAEKPARSLILPAIGSFLIWTGREIIPRIATYALDVIDGSLDHRDQLPSRRQKRMLQRKNRQRAGRRRQRQKRHMHIR